MKKKLLFTFLLLIEVSFVTLGQQLNECPVFYKNQVYYGFKDNVDLLSTYYCYQRTNAHAWLSKMFGGDAQTKNTSFDELKNICNINLGRIALTTQTIKELTTSTTYDYRTKSNFIEKTSGAYTTAQNFTTSSCNTPTNVSATVAINSATISWANVSGATSYTVQYRMLGATTWVTSNATASPLTISTLFPATYQYAVRANCSDGSSSLYSATQNFTLPIPPCNAPTNLTTTNVTTNSATLSWATVTGASYYTVEYKRSADTEWSIINTVLTNSTTLSNLLSGTLYNYRVQVICSSGGASSFTNGNNFTTLSCTTPTAINVSIVGNATAIAWTVPNNILSTTLDYREQGTTTWASLNTLGIAGTTQYSATLELAATTTYEYRLKTNCSANSSSSYSPVTTFVTGESMCFSPIGMNVISSANSATIDWDDIQTVTGYEVQYKLPSTTTWTTLNVTTSNATLSGLTTGTTYQYRIRTKCSSTNYSIYTPINTFTTITPTCGIPTGLVISANSTAVTVSWTNVAGASNYEIQYREQGQIDWTTMITTTNPYTLLGASVNTNYEFRIRAYCSPSSSWSSYTNIVTYTTSALVCGVPTGVSASISSSPTNPGTVAENILWTLVANANGYQVRYRQQGVPIWATKDVPTGTSVVLTALDPSKVYEYQVRTKCYANNSCYSQYSALATFTSANLCMSVTGVYCTVSANSVSVYWNASTSNTSAYEVQYKLASNSTWLTIGNTYGNSIVVEGLLSNTSYDFRVKRTCALGLTSYSNISSATTGIASCNTPTNIVVSNITTASATISWTTVLGISSYIVRYKTTNGLNWINVTASTNSITLSGLGKGVSYQFIVASNCPTSGISPYSTSQNFTTVCPAPTTTPTVSSITNNSANVSWSAVSGIGAYDVRYKTTAASTWSGGSPWSYTTNKTLTGLTPSTAYLVKVASVCQSVSSAYSPQASFTTLTQLLPFNGDVTKTTLSEEATNLVIHPNPADDIVWLNCESHTEQSAIIYMYDIMGRLMKTEQLKLSIGANKLSLDISSLPVGYYNIQLKLNNETINAKLMKR